jgi:Bacterial PH domain
MALGLIGRGVSAVLLACRIILELMGRPSVRSVSMMGQQPAQPAAVPFDKQDQLQQIQSGLMEGERILAVYDAIGVGTGFIGLTDRRVIVQDKSFVGKKVAITSIPYSKITSVSVVSNKSWAGSFFSSGSIAIHVGTQTYEVDFRGNHKGQHVHNVILHYIAGT